MLVTSRLVSPNLSAMSDTGALAHMKLAEWMNGCTDDTRAVVDECNVRFESYDQRGKLPAIQATLKKMGMAALEPMLLLDGDTTPIFPHSWHDAMMSILSKEERPTYI